jgi:peptidoglycan/xylan/chitin deacetylase (PgdA/CDA1 family)
MRLGQISGVPILDYHRIVPAGASAISGDRFAVHESEFRNHLQLLRDLKIAAVMPEDIASGGLPATSVALTFDDGYTSHYEVAFPLMTEFGMLGTFFVITSRVGTDEFLDWTMAAEMARAGMRFGSHAHNHVVLTTLNSERVKEELRVSRQLLEQRLSCAIEVLAVPYGFCDQHVLNAAWESGYQVVCTSRPWPAQVGNRVLSRVGVSQQTSLSEFRKLIENDRAVYLRLWARDCALAVPRYVFVRLKPELLGVRTAEGSL